MADKKYDGPVRCSASALIPLSQGHGGGSFRNFANMNSADELDMMEASAPMSHRSMLNTIKAHGKIREDNVQQEAMLPRQLRASKRAFGKGAIVKDRKERRKGTIIAAAVGHTRRSNTPVHRVCDKNGNAWLAKQSDLELVI